MKQIHPLFDEQENSCYRLVACIQEVGQVQERIDLAAVAARFIIRRVFCDQRSISRAPWAVSTDDPITKSLRDYILHILRSTQFDEKVLYASLMVFDRAINLLPPICCACHGLHPHSIGTLMFHAAYAIAADSMGGISVSTSQDTSSLDPAEGITFANGSNLVLVSTDWMIQGLKEDFTIEEGPLFDRFKTSVSRHYKTSQGPFPLYPRTLVTSVGKSPKSIYALAAADDLIGGYQLLRVNILVHTKEYQLDISSR